MSDQQTFEQKTAALMRASVGFDLTRRIVSSPFELTETTNGGASQPTQVLARGLHP